MVICSALLALFEGNSPFTGEFPSQRPVTRSFDVFFDARLNKRLSKQSGRRWFETPSHSLWRHCNMHQWWYDLLLTLPEQSMISHDVVIKWIHFPRYWPFVRGIHRSPVNSPTQRPVTRSFDAFFDLRLNKRLRKHSWDWFETPSRPLWRDCNELFLNLYQWHFQCDSRNVVDGATEINFDDSQADSQIIVTDFDHASFDTDSGIRSVVSNTVSLAPCATVRFAPDAMNWCSEPINLDHAVLHLVQRGQIGAPLINADDAFECVPARRIPMRQLEVTLSTDNCRGPPMHIDDSRRPAVHDDISGSPPVLFYLGESPSAPDGVGEILSIPVDIDRKPAVPVDISGRQPVLFYLGESPSAPDGVGGRLSMPVDIDSGSSASIDIDGRPSASVDIGGSWSVPVNIGGRTSSGLSSVSGMSIASLPPPFVSQITVTADSPPIPRRELSVTAPSQGPPPPQAPGRPRQLPVAVPVLVTSDQLLMVPDDPESTDSVYQGQMIIGNFLPPRHQQVHCHSKFRETHPQRGQRKVVRVDPKYITYVWYSW